MKSWKLLSLVSLSFFIFQSCSCNKEEPAPAPAEEQASDIAQPRIPDPEEVFPDESRDQMEIETPSTEKSEAVDAPTAETKPKPQVDPALIEQRIKTYRGDIASYRQKLSKFNEVQAKFGGDDPEFDAKFQESTGIFEEEVSNFEKRLKSVKKNPTKVQWENQEREWADEWRHVVRAFNDLEALYEKQYEGLK